MRRFKVVYDACVLYPFTLRDLLVQLALTDSFKAQWTNMIHDEWLHNLAEDLDRAPDDLVHIKDLMNESVRDALVTGFEDLIPSINLPDEKDRHVLAAAIRCNADAIITANLRDFPEEECSKYDIEILHPDVFLCNQMSLDQPSMLHSLKTCRARLTNPPKEVAEYISMLRKQALPNFSEIVDNYAELI